MHKFINKSNWKMLVREGFKPQLEPKVETVIIVCPFDDKFNGRMPNGYVNAGYNLLNTIWALLYVEDKIYIAKIRLIAR